MEHPGEQWSSFLEQELIAGKHKLPALWQRVGGLANPHSHAEWERRNAQGEPIRMVANSDKNGSELLVVNAARSGFQLSIQRVIDEDDHLDEKETPRVRVIGSQHSTRKNPPSLITHTATYGDDGTIARVRFYVGPEKEETLTEHDLSLVTEKPVRTVATKVRMGRDHVYTFSIHPDSFVGKGLLRVEGAEIYREGGIRQAHPIDVNQGLPVKANSKDFFTMALREGARF